MCVRAQFRKKENDQHSLRTLEKQSKKLAERKAEAVNSCVAYGIPVGLLQFVGRAPRVVSLSVEAGRQRHQAR